MAYFLLIVGLLIFPLLNNAQNADTSVTKTTWFWPLLSVCLALLLSVPCALITVVFFCHNKKNLDDSDESTMNSTSSSSSSSASPSPPQQRTYRHHARLHRSHYAGGFRSPPPPYTTNEQPENVFVTPSLPPPYESHLIENNLRPVITNPPTTIINVQPAESIENQSINNPRLGTTLDISSTLTNPSMQTFQA